MPHLSECLYPYYRVGIEDACHVAANLLKLYLRELPESILTNALKGDFEAGVIHELILFSLMINIFIVNFTFKVKSQTV